MSYCDKLLYYRKKSNMTQEQVAKLIDTSKANYCRYEKGRRKPDIETWSKLAKVLNFDEFPMEIDIIYPEEMKNELKSIIKKCENRKGNDENTKLFYELLSASNNLMDYYMKMLDLSKTSLEEKVFNGIITEGTVLNASIDCEGKMLLDKALKIMGTLL